MTLDESLKTRASSGDNYVRDIPIFFHAQRTGGTTLKRIFREKYGDNRCLFQKTAPEFKRWDVVDTSLLTSYDVYGGHSNFKLRKLPDGVNPLYFSIVRSPVERAISLYKFLKNRPDHRFHREAVELDILACHQEIFKRSPDYVSNTQTLRISGQKSFSVAIEAIEENFFFVAPFEKLSEAVETLRQALHWDEVNFEFRPPVLKESQYDQSFIDFISSINQSDQQLYEHVLSLWRMPQPGHTSGSRPLAK